MDATCSIVVIDDHRLIAEGCQSEFARAGLPWRVSWSRSLSEVQWPEGRTLVILDLRLNDGTRPAQVIGDLTDRPVPVVVYTSGEAPDLIRAAGRLDRQIAGDLNIRIKTVEAHRANIMDKFEVRTMTDLMRRFLGSSPD